MTIRWYGFLIAIGALSAYFFSLSEAKKNKIAESKFDSIFLVTLLFGIIGARIGFVVQNTSYFSSHATEIFKVWDGGLSIHGALILGAAALFISAKSLKLDFMKVANIIAPNVMLAAAIGRWGNFFNQEIVGKPTNSALRVAIDVAHRPIGFENISSFYPVFLFESVLLLIAFILYRAFKSKLENNALVYTLVIYSLIRIIVEFWRIDYKPIFIGLDLAQIVSSVIILVTILAALTNRKK
jgi:phosphatidylglycerol:prolipoprotein diacylglycerol transferase